MSIVTIEQAAEYIADCCDESIPALLIGPPGVGKTEAVAQVAAQRGIGYIPFDLSLREPVDMRGLPHVDLKAGTTRWLAPAELPDVKRHGERGILALEEINTASQSMQTTALALLQERRVGEYRLPDGWVCVATGNRLADKGYAQRMGTPMKNRFSTFEVAPDQKVWRKWAVANGVHPMMVAFSDFKPQLIHVMPRGEEASFPTPRSITRAAKFCDREGMRRKHHVAAQCGDAFADEFDAFARIYDRVKLIDILSNPRGAYVPKDDEPGLTWAICNALAHVASAKNADAILTYAARLPREFGVLIAVDARKRNPEVANTKAFTDWCVVNQDITIGAAA